MAEIKKFEPFILKWEGGAKYTNKKSDKGGATKYGITIATWRTVGYDKNGDGVINEKDVKLLDEEDFKKVPPVPQKLQEVVQFMMSGKQ